MAEYKRYTNHIVFLGLAQFLVGLQGLIFLPILTKNLSIEEYGTWIIIITTVGLIPMVAMLGLPLTMVRYLSAVKNKNEIQEGFYSITVVTIITAGIASCLLILFKDTLASILFDNQVWIVWATSVLIFFECINLLFRNYFRTFQQIKKYSLFMIFRTLLQLFLGGGLVIMGFGVYGVIIGYIISSISIMIIMIVLIISDIGLTTPKFKDIRKFLLFGLPTVPGNLSTWIVRTSDNYIISILLGSAYVGYYAPGYMLGDRIMIILIQPLSTILPAILSKNYDEGCINDLVNIIFFSLKYFLLISIPSFIGISLLSQPLLELWSTKTIASEGYLVTPIVALSGILFGIYTIYMQIFLLEKKTKIVGYLWVAAAILNIVLNILVIPLFGIIGAAMTTLLTFSFIFFITIIYSKKYFNLNKSQELRKKIIPRCLIASLLFIPIILLIKPHEILSISLVIFISIAVYLLSIYIMGIITKDEVKFIKTILIQSINKNNRKT